MRRLLLLLLLCSSPTWATIARVRQNSSTPASATTMAVTLTSVAAGDLLVVGFLTNNNVAVTSVVDDHSNTFSVAVASTAVASVGNIGIYYKENASVSAGTDTVTLTFGAATGGGEVAVAEYSGVATSTSLDQHPAAANGASGTTATTNSFNPTQSTELAITWTGAGGTGGNPTAGASYTNVVQPDAFTALCERISPPTGSQTATTTFASNAWGIEVSTFKASSASAGPNIGLKGKVGFVGKVGIL